MLTQLEVARRGSARHLDLLLLALFFPPFPLLIQVVHAHDKRAQRQLVRLKLLLHSHQRLEQVLVLSIFLDVFDIRTGVHVQFLQLIHELALELLEISRALRYTPFVDSDDFLEPRTVFTLSISDHDAHDTVLVQVPHNCCPQHPLVLHRSVQIHLVRLALEVIQWVLLLSHEYAILGDHDSRCELLDPHLDLPLRHFWESADLFLAVLGDEAHELLGGE